MNLYINTILLSKKNNFKTILFGNFFIIIFVFFSAIILFGLFHITDKLKQEELKKIEIYAASQKLLFVQEIKENEIRDFLFNITQDNKTIPVVLVDENENPLLWKNFEDDIFLDPKLAQKKINQLKRKYPPIPINIDGKKQFILYEESLLLRQLSYYPLLVVFFYLILLAFIIRHILVVENNKKINLWTGMAKETAHQLGTPLTSMAGWIELLKEEANNKEMLSIREIENDILRLNKIAFRFSKIGSNPELKKTNLIIFLEQTHEYLVKRISYNIQFSLNFKDREIKTYLDEDLFSWVIENLVNNSLDAMGNRGEIAIKVLPRGKILKIIFKDSGKGIDPSKFKEVFEPGYSTKKRGWGLGLSLVKRIVEDYHKGRIYAIQPNGKWGAVFIIELPIAD